MSKIDKNAWKEYEGEYVVGAYVMCVDTTDEPFGFSGREERDGVLGEIYQITRISMNGPGRAPEIMIDPNKAWWVSAYRFRPVSISRH